MNRDNDILVTARLSGMPAVYIEYIASACGTLRARSAVPNGYVLVPVDPTEAMIRAFLAEFYKAEKSFDTAACYRAMIAAAKPDGGE